MDDQQVSIDYLFGFDAMKMIVDREQERVFRGLNGHPLCRTPGRCRLNLQI
jgi:hypothetical protein